MPARGDVTNFQNGRIKLDDLSETDDCSVAFLGIAGTEKLPSVVFLVVRNVQDWAAIEDD